MDPRVAPLADILRLNTKLFRNCLDGLADATARLRPSPTANSAAFVAAHVADSRFFLLRVVGGSQEKGPLAKWLDGAKGIDDLKELPPLADVQAAWTAASHALRTQLDALTAQALDGPPSARFPAGGATMLSALTFLVQHDSYHVGQLALLRKQSGLPAMRYD